MSVLALILQQGQHGAMIMSSMLRLMVPTWMVSIIGTLQLLFPFALKEDVTLTPYIKYVDASSDLDSSLVDAGDGE